MYCKNCGNEVNKNAVVCPCCGCSVQSNDTSKKGLGFVLGFFLGLIGLIIGLCMYDSTSVEKKNIYERLANKLYYFYCSFRNRCDNLSCSIGFSPCISIFYGKEEVIVNSEEVRFCFKYSSKNALVIKTRQFR